MVQTVGTASDLGQEMAAEALAGLASDNESNQKDIAEILIKLLRESSPTGVEREKAARAVSRFAFCDGDGDGDGDGSGADLPDSLVASIDGLCVTVAACGLDDEASCTTFLNDTAPLFGASCYAAFEDLFVCMEALECDELEVFWTALTNDTPPTWPKACSAEVEATLAC